MTQPAPRDQQRISTWLLWVLWLLAGASLFVMLGDRSCQRTQEARVLVTAREMLIEGGQRWLLPTCNGEMRLQKPPLPYWLSAMAFAVTGQVNEWAGRLPAAGAAWVTLLLAYVAGSRWFSQRVGLLAAGILLSSLLFYQYGRLAETDIYATLFVTVGIVAAWRAMTRAKSGDKAWRTALWFAAAGAAAAGATLAKGPPGLYPFLFVTLFGAATRNWRGLLWTAAVSLPVVAALAAPWYVYIYVSGHWGVLREEIRVTMTGGDHPAPLWTLITLTLQATLPWSPFWVVSLVMAIRWRKTEANLTGLFCWLAAVYVPLMLTSNRQFHYVMPALPALALLCGWGITGVAKGRFGQADRVIVRFLVNGLLVVLAAGGLGAIVWAVLVSSGKLLQGTAHLPTSLRMVGIILLGYGTYGIVLYLRRGLYAGAIAAVVTLGVALPLIFGPVSEDVLTATTRESGRSILAMMDKGPLVSRGPASVPLVFATRRVIPDVPADQLPLLAAQDATVIVEAGPADGVVDMPAPWHMVWRGGPKGQHFQVFRAH